MPSKRAIAVGLGLVVATATAAGTVVLGLALLGAGALYVQSAAVEGELVLDAPDDELEGAVEVPVDVQAVPVEVEAEAVEAPPSPRPSPAPAPEPEPDPAPEPDAAPEPEPEAPTPEPEPEAPEPEAPEPVVDAPAPDAPRDTGTPAVAAAEAPTRPEPEPEAPAELERAPVESSWSLRTLVDQGIALLTGAPVPTEEPDGMPVPVRTRTAPEPEPEPEPTPEPVKVTRTAPRTAPDASSAPTPAPSAPAAPAPAAPAPRPAAGPVRGVQVARSGPGGTTLDNLVAGGVGMMRGQAPGKPLPPRTRTTPPTPSPAPGGEMPDIPGDPGAGYTDPSDGGIDLLADDHDEPEALELGGTSPQSAFGTSDANAAPAADDPPLTALDDLTVLVHIKTETPGVPVSVDGKSLGVTPAMVDLSDGEHKVSLGPGGAGGTFRISPLGDPDTWCFAESGGKYKQSLCR